MKSPVASIPKTTSLYESGIKIGGGFKNSVRLKSSSVTSNILMLMYYEKPLLLLFIPAFAMRWMRGGVVSAKVEGRLAFEKGERDNIIITEQIFIFRRSTEAEAITEV